MTFILLMFCFIVSKISSYQRQKLTFCQGVSSGVIALPMQTFYVVRCTCYVTNTDANTIYSLFGIHMSMETPTDTI